MAALRRFLSKPAGFSWLIEGKVAGSARPENEAQLRWLKSKGIKAIISLNKERPLDEEEVRSIGLDYEYIPIQDFAAPTLDDIKKFVSYTDNMLKQKKPVGVSCEAGIGRTGTMLAAYLVSTCLSPEEALEQVKARRGTEVESYSQRKIVFEYAHQLGKCQKPPDKGP